MAGSRGAAKKKAPRKAGAEGATRERKERKERPAEASDRAEKGEAAEKRPARKPVKQAAASPESTGIKGRIDEIGKFLKSVRAEMKRVTWPSGAEVRAATTVVVLTLVIISAYMGAVDWLLQLVFGQKHTGF